MKIGDGAQQPKNPATQNWNPWASTTTKISSEEVDESLRVCGWGWWESMRVCDEDDGNRKKEKK